jgi:hypothetical protein
LQVRLSRGPLLDGEKKGTTHGFAHVVLVDQHHPCLSVVGEEAVGVNEASFTEMGSIDLARAIRSTYSYVKAPHLFAHGRSVPSRPRRTP